MDTSTVTLTYVQGADTLSTPMFPFFFTHVLGVASEHTPAALILMYFIALTYTFRHEEHIHPSLNNYASSLIRFPSLFPK